MASEVPDMTLEVNCPGSHREARAPESVPPPDPPPDPPPPPLHPPPSTASTAVPLSRPAVVARLVVERIICRRFRVTFQCRSCQWLSLSCRNTW